MTTFTHVDYCLIYFFSDGEDCKDTTQRVQVTETSKCFGFRLSQPPEDQTLASVQLWVHLNPSNSSMKQLTNVVAALPAKYYSARYTLAVKEDFIGEGWVEMPLRHAIKRFAKSQHYIEITSKPSTIGSRGPLRPILALTYAVKNRARRQADPDQLASVDPCDPESECCLRSLAFDVKEDLDWDRVIIPKTFTANYCVGTCSVLNPSGSHGSSHSAIITALLMAHINTGEFPHPCCVPTKMENLSITYQKNDGEVGQFTILNMTATGCHCAAS